MIEYDPHHWRSHLFDINGSMFREIIGRVTSCVVWSAFVVLIHKKVHYLDLPETVHAYIGIALSLLLVFRTNASYDRFWEGRRLWGSIVNEARNLARGAIIYLKASPALRDEVIEWTSAWEYATMTHLRGTKGLGPAGARLPEAETGAVLEANHVPLAIAVRISTRLATARDEGLISDIILVSLEQNVQSLIDYLGGCERIAKTPLPYPYVVHLRRSLFLYCFTLPFALVDTFGWRTIVATLFVSYVLFGIEEIGVEIGDPFGTDINDLPLEHLCATIDKNLMDLRSEARQADTGSSGARVSRGPEETLADPV